MPRKRRSGRITKEIPIVLLGTDATGKVSSEETNTVVLSRHGAGVVTRYRFSPDELLTLRLPGTAKEAAIRLVGQIGGEPGRYIYGVTFVDPDPDFWTMEFPPPDPFEPASELIALECSMCQTRVDIEQGDIEEDVYALEKSRRRSSSRSARASCQAKFQHPVAHVRAENIKANFGNARVRRVF